jgi:c(7)-type cytochrome triheme protein
MLRYVIGFLLAAGLVATIWVMFSSPVTKEAGPVAPQPTPATTATAKEPVAAAIPPPDTIVFENNYGRSVFTHKQHYERVNGDCSTCHPKIFPQSREPINYKKANHRAAEATGNACAACHRVGGTTFAADSNCTKCHEVKH